jgi:hypothetical protein
VYRPAGIRIVAGEEAIQRLGFWHNSKKKNRTGGSGTLRKLIIQGTLKQGAALHGGPEKQQPRIALVDEITKLFDDSNRALESAVFVGMSREQEQRREQSLKEMHSLLERLQRKQEELERIKRQGRAAGSKH